jgi:GGDEF domain-containing protein
MAKKMIRRIRNSRQKDNTEHANRLLGISFDVSTAKKSKPLHETLKAADASTYREKRNQVLPHLLVVHCDAPPSVWMKDFKSEILTFNQIF